MLKPVGNTPEITLKKVGAKRHDDIAKISNIIRGKIGSKPGESIFIYVRSSFAPTPDARIGDLFDVSFK